MIKIYKSMFLVFGFALMMTSIRPDPLHAQEYFAEECATTTCISNEMIEIAHHVEAPFDPLLSYADLLLPPPIEACKEPRETGVMVHKQIVGEIQLFKDTLCTNQGCVPAGEPDGRICQ